MRNRWIAPLLALALTIAPASALAYSHGDDGQAPAGAYTDIVDAFKAGDPSEAESTYRQAFADDAKSVPHVSSAIEDGLEKARQAEPGSAQYAWATQVAKKGVLAVSYHAVHAAAEAGDADRADDYVGVLTTKFDGADQLAETKQAFADVDAQGLDAAVAVLDTEYDALITAKVYAETEETPELLEAGDPTTAAKEAGEALGYGLSLQDHLNQTAGEATAETFREELEELGEFALAEDVEGARAEASEILDLLAEHALTHVPTEKTDARQAFVSAVEDGRFAEAGSTYEDAFAEEASEYAPRAHARIEGALDQAPNATGANLTVQQQILEKSILHIAWGVGFTELAEEEIDEATAYLAILVDKFDSLEQPSDIGRSLGTIQATGQASGSSTQALRSGLTDAFLDKVHEEIDEVFINWNNTETAREKAIEGVLYYQPIRDEVAKVLSDEDADHLDAELMGLYNATVDRNRTEAEHEAEEARSLLTSFENQGKEVSELDTVLSEIERTLEIITVEIDEYFEYKEKGDEAAAQEEVEESKAFIRKVLSTIEDNRDALAAANEDALGDVEANAKEIQTLLEEDGDLQRIPTLVDETVQQLDAFQGSESQGPTVDVRIGPASPADGDAYWVPIHLVGVPDSGFSVEANLTYNTQAFTVEEVEIPAQVGASTTEPGLVRFNAASTGDAGTEPVVAKLKVIPGEAANQPDISVEVTTLTDAEGNALTLGETTGTDLDLSAADEAANDTSGAPAPGPGLWLSLAAVGLTAILGARRQR